MLHFKVLFLAMTLLSGCVTTDPLRYKQLNPMPAEDAKEVALILNTYSLKTPSPTVIYAHGCSGLNGAYLDWKNKLNDWGYNVVQPDSLRSRGFNTACKNSGVANITHNDRLEDILKTAEWVKEQPWHKGKIGVFGFSMGGRATLNLASDGGDLYIFKPTTPVDTYKNINISAAVAYYPMCLTQHKDAKIPTMILIGDADDWTPPTWCGYIAGENEKITLKTYPGVHHGFDTPGLNQINSVGHMVKYDQQAAIDAEQRTKEFFEKYLNN